MNCEICNYEYAYTRDELSSLLLHIIIKHGTDVNAKPVFKMNEFANVEDLK